MKKLSIRWKIILAMVIGMILMTLAFVQISFVKFRDFEIEDCTAYAKALTQLIRNDILDVDKIDDYLERGRDVPGYNVIERKLSHLRDAYPDIIFLYVYQVREDGFHVVFDLNTDEVKASEPGDVEPFEYFPSFEKYIPDLLAGKEIPPIESHEYYGHLLTVYTPVYDVYGVCKCYVGADYSFEYLQDYSMSLVKQILIFFGAVLAVLLVAGIFLMNRDVGRQVDKLQNDAYRDTLTKLQNRTAFYRYTAEINKKLAAGGAGDFSTLMIDVNYLKRMNDVYGHEQGNIYLQGAGDLMKKIFGDENLYRVGGDEFVVLLEGSEQEGVEHKIREFKEEIARRQADESLQPWEKISAAVGIASFDKEQETTVDETLRRADEAMYKDKVAMKAVRRD